MKDSGLRARIFLERARTSVQIQQDTCSVNRDFGFGPLPPVGGVLLPVNKLEILTPYVALAGLIAVISSAVVVEKRRD